MIQDQQAIVNYALENEENLGIAFLIHQSYSLLCKDLAVKFHQKLRERIKEVYNGDDWIIPNDDADRLILFMIKNKRWPESVAFGCRDFNDSDRFCFHVTAEDNLRHTVFAAVDTAINGRKTGVGWWFRLKIPYNRWEASLDGVKALYNPNDLINYILENFRLMSDSLERHFNQGGDNNS